MKNFQAKQKNGAKFLSQRKQNPKVGKIFLTDEKLGENFGSIEKKFDVREKFQETYRMSKTCLKKSQNVKKILVWQQIPV